MVLCVHLKSLQVVWAAPSTWVIRGFDSAPRAQTNGWPPRNGALSISCSTRQVSEEEQGCPLHRKQQGMLHNSAPAGQMPSPPTRLLSGWSLNPSCILQHLQAGLLLRAANKHCGSAKSADSPTGRPPRVKGFSDAALTTARPGSG